MIKCSECDHENEAQRVYCHNCGARLDRSELIEEAQNPKKVAKPEKRGLPEGSASGIKNFFKTIIYAVLMACLIQAVRPPDGAPADRELGENIIDAPSISVDLEEAVVTPRMLQYSEAQLNAYLKNRVKPPKEQMVPTWAAAFDCAFVNLGPNSLRLTKKFLIFTRPIYVGGIYTPQTGPGGLEVKVLGGNIGRLPINGVLFDLVDDFLFVDFAKNLGEEAKSAGKMQSVEVTPKMVVISSRKKI